MAYFPYRTYSKLLTSKVSLVEHNTRARKKQGDFNGCKKAMAVFEGSGEVKQASDVVAQ